MLSKETLAAAEALEDLHRALGVMMREEKVRRDNKKDWLPDKGAFREIMLYETDIEPHFSVGDYVDLDDVRYAIRAELGRDFDTASLQLRDGDPERWYECGEETWEPEEPPVVSDLQIYRLALVKEHARREQASGFASASGRRNAPAATLRENHIEWLAWHD